MMFGENKQKALNWTEDQQNGKAPWSTKKYVQVGNRIHIFDSTSWGKLRRVKYKIRKVVTYVGDSISKSQIQVAT
jgi:hypothetical protein